VAIDRQEQKYGPERREGQNGDGYEERSTEKVAADEAQDETPEEEDEPQEKSQDESQE
jgi:hypothetical protein